MEIARKEKEVLTRVLSSEEVLDALYAIIDTMVENKLSKMSVPCLKNMDDEAMSLIVAKGGCLALNELKSNLKEIYLATQ